jgi:signal transduction histidine kinase
VYPETSRRTASDVKENRLAASLAHEINNPLDSVLNFLYLLRKEAVLTDKGRQYLMLAEGEVHRVSQIANAVLDSYRDSAAPQDTDVPKLIDSAIDVYRPLLESQGICVNTRYRCEGDVPVYPGLLREVFSNLLLNAAAAMPNGGRLLVRASNSQEWSGQRRHGVRLTFADSGCGIASENLHEIFRPFFTTKVSGSGLGLSIAKEVVERHGGSLRVRSCTKSGRSGSVFAMFVPSALGGVYSIHAV